MSAKASRTFIPIRTADTIRAEIAAAEREAQEAIADGLTLKGREKAVLLLGDDAAHKRHDDDVARLRRIVERADARKEELTAELKLVEAREASVVRDNRKAEAEAAVSAIVAKAQSHYSKPAATIAAFLAEWREADRLAREAGVLGPAKATGRIEPSRVAPGAVSTVTAYLDEQGNRTQNPHPYKPDGMLDRHVTREAQTFTDQAPDRIEPGRRLPELADLVNLPKLTEHGEHHTATARNLGNRWS